MALVLPLPAWSDPIPPPVRQRIALLPPRSQAPSKLPPIPMILQSGVPDRDDRSRIIFEFAEGRGTIEARLQNDDSLLFRLVSYSGDNQDLNLRITSMPGDLKTIQSRPTGFLSGTTR